MDLSNNMCDNLANILNGKGKFENGICSVTIDRHDIQVAIGNKPFHSLHHMFNFESPDAGGNYLITGELVLLEKEVSGIIVSLANAGIIVSALHSHWLFDNPKLMYIHVEAITNPVNFATRMAQILKERT
jgi:hypothetical protein